MTTTKDWISTAAMATHLGIHPQTILKLRRSDLSPFREGVDFRWAGLTTNGNLQWHLANAESSFTNFHRLTSDQFETYLGKNNRLPSRQKS